MAICIGRLGWLGVGLEDDPGSEGSIAKYIPFISNDFRGVVEVMSDESAKGVRENVVGSQISQKKGEGSVEINLDVENSPYFIYGAMGGVSSQTASGESVVYEHTFFRKANCTPRTLTIVNNRVTDTQKYLYSVVSQISFSVSDGLATMTTELLSKSPESGSGTPAQTTEEIFSFKDYTIKLGANLTAADIASPTKLSSFELTINNNSVPHFMSGDSSPYAISHGPFNTEGNYSLFFESTTEKDAYEALTKRAAVITFTGESIGVGSNKKIEIRIDKFHLARSISIIVTNETASY
jgi:hypothetical protein